ncbi:hypothetical protein B0H34DRAFT_663367 [Crassisporium funariophilum]|nr:hypothetical protein B0H34DRAFT_663367 [Crassisporium funariophilum]
MLWHRSKITKHRGTYNTHSRDLACHLCLAGCAPSKIGSLITWIAALFGVTVKKQMSRRTVGRCMLKSLAAADIQLVDKLSQNPGHTISQDSTSNQNINYQAHQVTMQVPDYEQVEGTPSLASTPCTQLLRVASTVDHTAPTLIATWVLLLQATMDTYNNSPMAQRSSQSFSLQNFALKLKGMCLDHASAKKAASDLLRTWKESETMQDLGETELSKMDVVGLIAFLNKQKAVLIKGLGGVVAWNTLGDVIQSKHEVKLMNKLKEELGQKVYATLPSEACSALDLFVWAGCCMHKDQNSFKGSTDVMALFWTASGLVLPIILANKTNAAKIRDVLNPSQKGTPLTADKEAAIAASTRGGVKAAALAGALLNNKDDKKGFGDTHLIHLSAEHGLKETRRFPDTSNTCFTSYGLAAGKLLKHLEFYQTFLDNARLRKQQVGWTNIELNLNNALYDKPTLTKLAVMVLYTQSVTHPYLRVVRGSGENVVNVLDLGPFHQKVCNHCQAIVNNPNLLVLVDASFELGALDGKSWEDTDSFLAVRKLLVNGKLRHLCAATVAFFEGALVTWIRFSAEFAPGGTIDALLAEERDLAWMPATNNVNKGALGAYRVYMRSRPNSTLLSYNAFAVCQKNNTLAFMGAKFNEEDNRYVQKVARKWDSSGMERERKNKHANSDKQLAEMKHTKEAATRKEAEERRNWLSAVVFVVIGNIKRL